MKYKLSDICEYAKGKVAVETLDERTYISTENMLPNKGGIDKASSLPTIPQTQEYLIGDVLVSNIRPYFKKIWHAEFEGGCSNDVLVFRAKNGTDPDFYTMYWRMMSSSIIPWLHRKAQRCLEGTRRLSWNMKCPITH